MERYSSYRDGGTGIAPFVSPVPPLVSENGVIGLALVPVTAIIALIRLLLVAILVAVKLALTDLISLFMPSPAEAYLSHAVNAGLFRIVMATLGFYWIQSEVPRPKAKGTSVQPGARHSGTVVVSNWSSPVDIFYLVFRFNCRHFILPVLEQAPPEPSAKSGLKVSRQKVIGVVRVGFWQALARTGYPPLVGTSHTSFFSNLHDALEGTRAPVAIFPEGTTSNNRGILRFCDIPLGGLRTLSPNVKVVSLRYDAPTALLSSTASPSPTLFNPLGALFRIANTLPLPRSLLVRALPDADCPTFAGTGSRSAEFWGQAAVALTSVGRWKQTSQVGAEEKFSFLVYAAHNKR